MKKKYYDNRMHQINQKGPIGTEPKVQTRKNEKTKNEKTKIEKNKKMKKQKLKKTKK